MTNGAMAASIQEKVEELGTWGGGTQGQGARVRLRLPSLALPTSFQKDRVVSLANPRVSAAKEISLLIWHRVAWQCD